MTDGTAVAPARARSRDLRPLVGSRAASTLAFSMVWIVLPVQILRDTGSALAAGLAATGNVLPYVVLGVFIGAALDGRDLRTVMVGAEAVNALVVGGLALAAGLGVLSPWTAAGLAVGSSVAFVVFDVANSAAVPLLLAGRGIVEWNGRAWMVTSVCGAVGAPLAVALYDASGPAVALAVPAGLYAVSALLVAQLPAVPGEPDGESGVRAGLAFIRRTRVVAVMTAVGLGSGLSGGAVYGMTVVFADRALGTPSGLALQAIVLASGAGAVLGAVAAPRLARARGTVPVVRPLLVLDTLLLLGFAVSPSWPAAAAAVGGWNAVHTAVIVLSVSIRQAVTPRPLQARVNGAAKVLAWGAVPVGTLLCGWLAEAYGIRPALVVMSGPVAVSALLLLLHRGREVPS
jgi:hypothetical protein